MQTSDALSATQDVAHGADVVPALPPAVIFREFRQPTQEQRGDLVQRERRLGRRIRDRQHRLERGPSRRVSRVFQRDAELRIEVCAEDASYFAIDTSHHVGKYPVPELCRLVGERLVVDGGGPRQRGGLAAGRAAANLQEAGGHPSQAMPDLMQCAPEKHEMDDRHGCIGASSRGSCAVRPVDLQVLHEDRQAIFFTAGRRRQQIQGGFRILRVNARRGRHPHNDAV
mmetsp:Transcript_15367/g.42131  ORF Transcript_15367/g.42131 Transcript_15367/m.42131 type:complete len:227 (+) Transcript_15367:609-1289(+)